MSNLADIHDRLIGATSSGLYDAARLVASLIDQGHDDANACAYALALRPHLFHDNPRLAPEGQYVRH